MSWDPAALLEALDHSVAVCTPDGTIVAVNAASERRFGRPRAGLIGAKLRDLLPAGDALHAAFDRVRTTGAPEVLDDHDAAQGRWYRSRVVAIDGQLHVFASDVTREQQAERRLLALADENVRALEAEREARRQAEDAAARTARLQAITAQLSEPLEPSAIAGVVLRESAAVLGGATAAIWRIDEAGAHLELLASRDYPDDPSFARIPLAVDAPVCAAVRDGAPVYLASVAEFRGAFPAAAARVAAVAPPEHATACVPLLAAGRRPVGVIAFTHHAAHEFTAGERMFLEVLADQCAQALERRRLRAQEAAASRTLAAIVAASPAAIMLLDLDGTVRLWNPAAERIFGWSAAEVVGGQSPAVGDVHAEELRTHLRHIAAGRPIAGVEATRLTRDRGPIDVALWAAPIVSPEGERQCIAVVVDITDRKRAEAAARAAHRRKDEFLAMLGHELRNPLAPILTALQLIQLRGVHGIDHELGIIDRQTRYLVRLVDDLLDIARITRGGVDLRRAPTDLAVVVARAVEMASPLIEERGQHLTIAVPHAALVVEGDEFRLAQVFHNLLTNAARYMHSGGSIAVRAAAEDGRAVVEVIDDGVGIDPELLPAVFEPFVQGARSLDRAEGGLGIGLALVHSLVTAHGGAVTAHSAGPGRGSRFVVSLPLLADRPAPAADAAAPASPADSGTRRRVLLVDDNHDAADMLAELLRLAGHDVRVAYDGPAALGEAAAFAPDVALLDIGLPVMDGYELARRLRADLVAPPKRLVALTGYGQDHDRDRSHAAGFHDHMVKPIDSARLLAMLELAG
jgi:PAS domain S-box-containing protein